MYSAELPLIYILDRLSLDRFGSPYYMYSVQSELLWPATCRS